MLRVVDILYVSSISTPGRSSVLLEAQITRVVIYCVVVEGYVCSTDLFRDNPLLSTHVRRVHPSKL